MRVSRHSCEPSMLKRDPPTIRCSDRGCSCMLRESSGSKRTIWTPLVQARISVVYAVLKSFPMLAGREDVLEISLWDICYRTTVIATGLGIGDPWILARFDKFIGHVLFEENIASKKNEAHREQVDGKDGEHDEVRQMTQQAAVLSRAASPPTSRALCIWRTHFER